MNNIIEIENYQGWKVSTVKCLLCKYKWVAVMPENTDINKLECLKCNNQKTICLI